MTSEKFFSRDAHEACDAHGASVIVNQTIKREEKPKEEETIRIRWSKGRRTG